jgi:hypothetical protein
VISSNTASLVSLKNVYFIMDKTDGFVEPCFFFFFYLFISFVESNFVIHKISHSRSSVVEDSSFLEEYRY